MSLQQIFNCNCLSEPDITSIFTITSALHPITKTSYFLLFTSYLALNFYGMIYNEGKSFMTGAGLL
ncbi:MAG: hypothetical protein IGQ45_04565 [Cyanobacterium sp. T60_A2020_053]|nr:hypothetical protein [Cyanobacterium sp. T60_A2020_053]